MTVAPANTMASLIGQEVQVLFFEATGGSPFYLVTGVDMPMIRLARSVNLEDRAAWYNVALIKTIYPIV